MEQKQRGGRPPGRRPRVVMGPVRFSEEQAERLRALADRLDAPVAVVIRLAVEQFLDAKGQGEPVHR